MSRGVVAVLWLLGSAVVYAQEPIANVIVTPDSVQVQVAAEGREAIFTLGGPEGFRVERTFSPDEILRVSLAGPRDVDLKQQLTGPEAVGDAGGGFEPLRDGDYFYEVRVLPLAEPNRPGGVSMPVLAQAGMFRIVGGEVVLPEAFRLEIASSEELSPSAASLDGPQPRDVVYTENIIGRAACLSSDAACVSGEALGIIDLKMKGNIPLIRWERTGAGDKSWDVDVDLGGFRIAQITDGRAPMLIADGAPTNSVRVDGFGRIGLGTSLPSENLHIVDSSDSSLRLQVGGQSWDLFTGSGSTSFRIFNATGGGIPLVIATDGDVGIGPSLPSESLHVRRSNGTAQLLVEEASGTTGDRVLLRLRNRGDTALRFEDTSGSLTAELRTNGSGLEVSGDFAVLSTRAAKNVVGPVDTRTVLSQLAKLPLEFWHYKDDPSGRIHLGPMAEDWGEAFSLGTGSESLSLVDATGVAIAGIQGLHEELRASKQSIEALRALNEELQRQVTELTALVETLMKE